MKKINMLIPTLAEPTGLKLLEALQRKGVVVTKTNIIDTEGFNLSWGYGSDDVDSCLLVSNNCLNNPLNVRFNANKYLSLKLLKNSGFPTVEVLSSDKILQSYRERPRVIIARPTHHRGGTDLMTCLCENDIRLAIQQGYTLFKDYIPNKNEYRLHVFNGQIIIISKKPKVNGVAQNHVDGCAFRTLHVTELNPLKYAQMVKLSESVKALGLNFGAVDVIEDERGKLWVLEVNTATGLSDSHIELYARMIEVYTQ